MKINGLENKRVRIRVESGGTYIGRFHKASDNSIVLSELIIVNKNGGCIPTNREARKFVWDKIKEISLEP